MFRTQKLCPGSKNVFDSMAKTFFVSELQNLFPQHTFPARLNWETFASATMFKQHCFLVQPGLEEGIGNSTRLKSFHNEKRIQSTTAPCGAAHSSQNKLNSTLNF